MLSVTRLRRKMQYALPVAVVLFALIFILGAFTMYGSGNDVYSSPGGAAGFARIGDQEISGDAFGRALKQQREQLQQFSQFTGEPASLEQLSDAPRYAYDQLLNEIAAAEAARKAGINVSESEAGETARKLIDERIEQLKAGGATEEDLAQYRSVLRGQLDLPSLRRQLAAQRLRERLVQEASANEIRVAHVLIKPKGGTDWESARKAAADIARQARAGTRFEDLVKKHSEDEGSKAVGGVVGWASAMPAQAPAAADKKPKREPAGSFVEEFTAASLGLKPGEVSDPVRSSFGYHVIKALEVREYAPDAAAAADPKKRDEALNSYRQQMADRRLQAMLEAERSLLETQIDAKSPWLRGHLAERSIAPAVDGKKLAADPARDRAIAGYTEALSKNDPAAGAPLAWKLAKLHQDAGRHEEALVVLDEWAKRSGDAGLHYLRGVSLEALKRKTDAVEAYKEALDKAYSSPRLLEDVATRFKALGRKDLAASANKKSAEQRQRQTENMQRQQENMLRQQAELEKETGATGAAGDDGTIEVETEASGAGAAGAAGDAPGAPAPSTQPGPPAKP